MITRRPGAVWLTTAAFFVPLAVAPSAAATAPSSWPDTDNPPLAQALLFIVGVPILLFAVIFLLSYLPSMIRSQRGASVESWHDEPEWFGGPSKGAAAEPEATQETGGASARW